MSDIFISPTGFSLEPHVGAAKAFLNGELVGESENARILREGTYTPVIYFPLEDILEGVLRPSEHTTFCPKKGTARHWHVVSPGGATAENSAWSYPDPLAEAHPLSSLVAFYPAITVEAEVPDPTS